MKKSLLLPILFICCFGYSQDNSSTESIDFGLTPFNPKSKYYNIDLRATGGLYPWGNGGGAMAGFGFDVGIGRRQSIGVEAVYYTYGDAEDDLEDINGVHYDQHANVSCTNSTALFLHYRYYLNWQYQRQSGIAPYISAFARYGRSVAMRDQNFFGNDYTMKTDIQRSAGIVVGSVFTMGESNFGYDLNVGGFYKTHDIKTDYIELHNGKVVPSSRSNFGIRIGFSINYWFDFKRRK